MQIIGIDFETYWSQEYTLSKLNMQEYVQHPDFRAHGASIKVDQQPAFWVGHDQLPAYFARIDWSKTAVAAHNCSFDAAILNWHYGVNPRLWIDTLGMSRAVIGSRIPSHGLDRVAKYLGLAGKVRGGVLNDTKGIRVLTPEQEQRMGAYALDDIEDTRKIFDILRPHFPAGEYSVLDWTIRCFVDRTLMIDPRVCMTAHREEVARKEKIFEELAMGDPDRLRSIINSNAQFAKMLGTMLEPYGEAPPEKLSAATGKKTWAFGKTDEEFTDLLSHDDERIAALVQARLDTKGALAETRAVKFVQCVRYDKERRFGAGFNYAGAVATQRLSGSGSTNLQNLPHNSPLKRALRAPPGHVIIDVDLSQIELRISALAVGQDDIVGQLRTGADTYSSFASHVFERPITKKEDPEARQTGKVAVLSCTAKGSLVLTSYGVKRIEDVRHTDLVWDGEEFVEHDGVKYMGRKRVIQRGPLRLTPDHRVLRLDGEWAEFGCTALSSISKSRLPSGDVWEVDSTRRHGLPRHVPLPVWGDPCSSERQPTARPKHAVCSVRARIASTMEGYPASETAETVQRDAGQMHEPERKNIQALRWPWRGVPVRVGSTRGRVGIGELTRVGGVRDRPHRQQRPLRAGQSTVRDAKAADYEHEAERVDHAGGAADTRRRVGGVPVHNDTYPAVCYGGSNVRADRGHGVAGGGSPQEELGRYGGEAHATWAPATSLVRGGHVEFRRARGANENVTLRTVAWEAGLGGGVGGTPSVAAHGETLGGRGVDGRADSGDGLRQGSAQAYGVEGIEAPDGEEWADTYDIINCGPRHRFACDGYIVHNCGYGVSHHAFRKMLRVQAKVNKDLDFCKHVVDTYRSVYPMYPKGWRNLTHMLARWAKHEMPDADRRLNLPVEWGMHEITLPSGLKLKYPDFDQREVFDKFRGENVQAYTFASEARGKSFQGRQKVYGAMMLENASQALAAEVIKHKTKEIIKYLPAPLQVHDALAMVAPEAEAEQWVKFVKDTFEAPVPWWPELPLGCELGFAHTYGDIKKS